MPVVEPCILSLRVSASSGFLMLRVLGTPWTTVSITLFSFHTVVLGVNIQREGVSSVGSGYSQTPIYLCLLFSVFVSI